MPLVVITRPRAKAGPMQVALEARGFRTLLAPTIRLVPPDDPAPLRAALADLSRWDWITFTSAAAVQAVEREVEAGMPWPKVAVVGPATRRAVEEWLGQAAALMPPTRYTAEGLLERFRETQAAVAGSRVLLPLAELGGDVLPEGLRALGAREVRRVTAYRTVAPEPDAVARTRVALGDATRRGERVLLTFTSPSTAENLLELMGPAVLAVPAAAIGPVTADAARELGYAVVAEADPHTVDGLVEAAVAWAGLSP